MTDAEGIQIREHVLGEKYCLFYDSRTYFTDFQTLISMWDPRLKPFTINHLEKKTKKLLNLQAIGMFSPLFVASYKMLHFSLQMKQTLFVLDLYNNNNNYKFYS